MSLAAWAALSSATRRRSALITAPSRRWPPSLKRTQRAPQTTAAAVPAAASAGLVSLSSQVAARSPAITPQARAPNLAGRSSRWRILRWASTQPGSRLAIDVVALYPGGGPGSVSAGAYCHPR